MVWAIWAAVVAIGLMAVGVFLAAYRLHIENDRALGPCAIHRLLGHRDASP